MKKHTLIVFAIVLLINIVSAFFFYRFDLTSEKRFTISDNTKNLMRGLNSDLKVTIYLSGDLNMGFLRLKKATAEMLDEFDVYTKSNISYEFVNPSKATSTKERNKTYDLLQQKGMSPTVVYDKDSEGKLIQKVIFPWVEFVYQKDTVRVNLLKNLPGKSGDENLNISIENLEFELTDAIRRITTQRNSPRVAFIEGHGELEEPYVYSITSSLAKYYNVDRGTIGTDVSMLDPYKVVIIAGPHDKFSETEKFIIDQYIMRGGKVLWLVDGVRTSLEALSQSSTTVGIVNEVNLEDQLFTYGVRVDPVLIADTQCAQIQVNVAPANKEPQFELAPWYYFPLLQPSPVNVITKNIAPIRAEFASVVEFVGENQDKNMKREILLRSSYTTAVEMAPMQISLDMVNTPPTAAYFNNRYVPVAVLMEGKFLSVFNNRMPPKNIQINPNETIRSFGKKTKMIVIADGDIIRNDVQGFGTSAQPLPLGYDRNMDKQFGNGEFILNAVNYLADDQGWMELRAREIKLRLLDKQRIISQRVFWQTFNVVVPFVLLIVITLLYQWSRKRKYTREEKMPDEKSI